MRSYGKGALVRRRLLAGAAIGLTVTVFDIIVFFLIAPIREAVLGVLSRLMEPLLLVTPLAVAAICLIGYLLTFAFPDRG